MGYDEENLEPVPLNKKNLNRRSYLVIYEQEKREINAKSFENLIQNIHDSFNIDLSENIKIETWSDLYQEWILIEKDLPEENSKLKIKLENQEENNYLKNEVFVENLNLAFKNFIESDLDNELNNFETAVIFVLKRKENLIKSQNSIDEIKLILNEHQITLNNLNNELKKIKNITKQFKTDLECINKKICSHNQNSSNIIDSALFTITTATSSCCKINKKKQKKASCIIS